ncbi:MAG: FAD:protein FMN transferase [Acidobacteria bacterium]|nr:FAD:protein FMN transferase [Acidobacteriota bacterium]
MWKSSRAVFLLAAGLNAANLQRFEAVEPHMGTLVRITLYAGDEGQARRGFQTAFLRIHQLDEMCSDYNPASEINRLPARVSPDLFRILTLAQRLARETGGAFDVTAGPLIRVWRQARRHQRLPTPEALAEARAVSGYQLLSIRRGIATLTKPGMQLDLGGIAKGYAAQAALDVLRKNGVSRAIIAISGDLAIGDPPPGEQGWRVRVEPNPGHEQTLILRNRCVSTSGDREQYMQVDGVRYSHIIDPRTGQALRNHRGVTVIGRNGALVDAWAKALCILGDQAPPRNGIRVLR